MMTKECACKGIRFCRVCEENKLSNKALQGPRDSVYLTFCNKCMHVYLYDFPDKKQCENHIIGFELDGLRVIDNFLTEEEEIGLIDRIDESPWLLSQSGRSKQDYGAKVNFKKKRISLKYFTGLPDYSRFLVERLHQRMRASGCEFKDFFPVELCNLEYLPERGASIVPHLDDSWLWGERLVLLNLASETKMTFTLPPTSPLYNEEWPKFKKFAEMNFSSSRASLNPSIAVPLPRRSLLIMAGRARFAWFHAINREDITARRLSLTMRELSNEYMPPYAAIKQYAVCREDNSDSEETDMPEITENQKLGLELIKIASCYSGSCVAIASGDPAMT